MANNQTINHVRYQKIQEATSNALNNYLSLDPNKRQELEKNGINIVNFVNDYLQPVVNYTSIGRLLIIMEEGIGNMVMLTPAIKLLKHSHPLLKITVLCKEPSAQVIRGWNLVDKVITEPDDDYYDLCFQSIWSQNMVSNWSEWISRHCKITMQSVLRLHHEALQQAAVVEFLGDSSIVVEPHCEIQSFDNPIFNTKYIVFGDTSLRSNGWDVKRWPHYPELARLIYKKFPEYKIVLIGDDEDKRMAEQKEWPENVTKEFMGTLNIPQLAYLLKNCAIYIGNDTGPTHIAAAVGAKTYAIFAPTLVSKNKPLGKNVTILNKRLPCSPCQYTERFGSCECIGYMSANEVYNEVFFPENNNKKKRVLLVGDFSGGAWRNELYIKQTLEKAFHYKVIPYDYRATLNRLKDPFWMSYDLLNTIVHHEPDQVLICGGQGIVPAILAHAEVLAPDTKLINWYVDNRGDVEQWFYELSSVCHKSHWSTGDPALLSKVFSQTQRPCEFGIMAPSEEVLYPLDVEKDIDVLFIGTPHSAPRIELLRYLLSNGINVQIYGNGQWPDDLKSKVKPGVFGEELNKLLNRAKIVLNTNIINNVPLYFSDRYFMPMAVKTVGLNQAVPKLEEMFEIGKDMVTFENPQQALALIKELLEDTDKRAKIAQHGYNTFMAKYTLKHSLERIME